MGLWDAGAGVVGINSHFLVCRMILGAINARGVGRERRGNLKGGCMSKLCVE